MGDKASRQVGGHGNELLPNKTTFILHVNECPPEAPTMEEELSNQACRTGAANASLHLSSLWCWYNECMNTVAVKERTEDESRRRKQARIRLCEERAGREKVPSSRKQL